MVDFGNTNKVLDLPITYCPSIIKIDPVEFSAAQLNQNQDVTLDLTPFLSKYGITADHGSELTRKSYTAGTNSDGTSFPVIIDNAEFNENENSFGITAAFATLSDVSSGMEHLDDELSSITLILISMPQEKSDPSLVLLKSQILIPIRIID